MAARCVGREASEALGSAPAVPVPLAAPSVVPVAEGGRTSAGCSDGKSVDVRGYYSNTPRTYKLQPPASAGGQSSQRPNRYPYVCPTNPPCILPPGRRSWPFVGLPGSWTCGLRFHPAYLCLPCTWLTRTPPQTTTTSGTHCWTCPASAPQARATASAACLPFPFPLPLTAGTPHRHPPRPVPAAPHVCALPALPLGPQDCSPSLS